MRKVIFKAISVFTTLAMLTTAMPLKSMAADTSQATQEASQKIQAEFFVSTIGDDSNPGTYAQPFATLQGARDAVRKINKNMTGNIIVNIAAGDYYLSQTLDLNTQDSGTNGYNIIYKSTDGVGAAKLYGGQPVDPKSWILADDTDTANYGMLSSMVGKVYKTHLDPANNFNTLYVNDSRAMMARTPNWVEIPGFPEAKDGYNRMAGWGTQGKNVVVAQSSLNAEQVNGMKLAQQNSEEVAQVFSWDGGTGGEGGTWDWFTDTFPITSMTTEGSNYILDFPDNSSSTDFYTKYQYWAKYQISNGSRYFLQGNISFLDAPGEYHYNKKTGWLYYYPKAIDGEVGTWKVVAPTMQTVINIKGTNKQNPDDKPDIAKQAHNIVIDGLAVKDTEFSGSYTYSTNWGDGSGPIKDYPPEAKANGVTLPSYCESADRPMFQVGNIRLQDTNNITISNTNVKNAGIYGIFMAGDNQYDKIKNTAVEYCGDGGISIDGGYPGVGKYNNHNTFENILIHDVGQLVGHGVGFTIMSSGQNTFTHMEIYNSPKRGLLVLGGYSRSGSTSYDKNYDCARDGYTVGNHFSYIYVHNCQQDAGEDSSVFMSWLDSSEKYWYGTSQQHGSADLNALRTNLTDIDTSIDRYNYVDQMLIADIGASPSVHEKCSVGALDCAMGAAGFVFTNVQGINTQEHSLAVRYDEHNELMIMQNCTNNINGTSDVQNFDKSKMQYDQIGLTASFPTELRGTNQRTYANQEKAPSKIYFSDKFTAPTLDPTNWVVEKGTVDMTMGNLASAEDPRLGSGALPIYTPYSPSGCVVSRTFPTSLNKVVSVKFFDRRKEYCPSDDVTINPNDSRFAHMFLRADDGTKVLGIGADGYTSKDYYVIQKDSQTITTDVPRYFGWHTLKMDYSSGNDVKLYVDGQQVADYAAKDEVATSFNYVGMGDWGTTWAGTKTTGGSTFFSYFYIYGGQDAPALTPIQTVPPTEVVKMPYTENFEGYNSTATPTGWHDSRIDAGNGTPSTFITVTDPDKSSNKCEQIKVPDGMVYYNLGDTSWTDYTFTCRTKFAAWDAKSDAEWANFGISAYVQENNSGNVNRYELRYSNCGDTKGQWSIYQRGGNPTDNTLISNIKMPDGFNMNNWNTYKIVTGNGTVTFYVNDTKVAQVDAAANASGGFGFGGYAADFYVDDISVVHSMGLAPQANISSGTYDSPISVKLANSGDAIYYTTDSSDPVLCGKLYTGRPLTIANTCTLKVVSVKNGVYSATVGYNYIIKGTTAIKQAAGVNKIPLRDAINSANTVTKDNYTGASWAAFTAAIASAQNALYNSEATNADITNAIAEMQNTRVKLIPVLNTASSSNIYIQDFSSFAAGNTFNNDSASLGSSNAWEKYKTSTFSTNVAADPDDGNNNVLDVVLGDDAYVAYPYDAAATKLQNYTYSLRAKMKNWTVGNSQEPWSNFQLVLYAGKNIPIETKNPVLYGIRVQMSDTTKIGLYKRQNADIGYGGGTNPYKVYDLPAGFDITQWHTYKIKADTANTNTSAKTADVTITLWIDGSLIGSWTDKGTNVYQGGFGFNAYGPEFLVDDICVTDNSSTIAAPTADIATGTYAAPISVNVTPGAAGEKMYYTLDGSDPSTNGMLYTGAIAINNSCTLKLIELNSSNAASNVISYSYTISAPKSVAPVAITNPRSMTVTASQPVSFQTLAYVTDGGTLTYQWQNSEDCGTTWSDIKGATDYYYDTAQVTAADNGTMYRCIITNTKNSLVAAFTTSPATLNITTLSLQPVSSSFKLTAKNVVPCDSVCNGKNGPKGTAQVTFTADTEGTYYYKLMYSGDTYVDSDGKLYIGYNDSSVTTVDTSGTGTPCVVGDNTISLSNIAPYVPYTIYIQEKDADGKLSNKLKVDIPAGKPNLTVATSGNGIVTQDVSGEYVSGSVVKLVATPAEGYHFLNWTSSDGGVFQNANSASTEYVTSFYDTTVTANFYQIASANLIKITTPAAITGLPNGTAKTAEALRLPAKVELVTDAGNVNANVTWDIDGSSYDPTVKTGQTFTVNGTVSLPTGVLNTNNVTLTTSIDVTVKAAPDTGDDIVPDEEDTIEMIRLSGANRYETCVKISQSGWKTSDYAVLATGEDFPDALSSAPLAKKYNAPILITNHKTLDSSVEKEIGRLGVKNIFIIGGTKAVSQRIEDKLTSKGIKCTRIQGSDRYETSAAIANHIGTSKEVVVATGENFPDALSIASYAAFKGMPILLTEAGTLPKAISKYIEKSGVTKTYVIGGMEVINDSVLNVVPGGERLNGSDRYATNVTILEKFASEFDLSSIYFATGENFPDALTGSAFAASMKSPIILVNSNITDSTSKFVKENISKIKTGYALGGSSVVPDSVKNLLTK